MPSIVKKHGLKSDNQVLTWTRKYRENPDLLTKDLRGTKSTGPPKTMTIEEMTLVEQNAYLRMENDILKASRSEKNPPYQVIDRLKEQYSIASLCTYFGFPIP
ncbi:transposase [Streptococcus sp. ZJ93]|uniref:transposase n=1 Tax=Streptococcus handemini TaxID=3161188 RepID=UPI0032EFB7BC